MATMKAWHIVVMDGWKVLVDKVTFSVGDSRTLYAELKTKYDELNQANALAMKNNPELKLSTGMVVKREWY